MRKPTAIVFDSWSIMAYLEDEPAGEQVANAISDANDDGTPLLMTVMNAGEVWYIIARRTSRAEADRTLRLLCDIGIKLVEADWPLSQIAAGYKVKGKISFADCYAAALAKQQNGLLLTGDSEFRQLEHEVTIFWLRNDV